MDIKSSAEKYDKAAGIAVDITAIQKTIAVILKSGLPHTFRTTAVPGIVDKDDISKIGELLKGVRGFSTSTVLSRGLIKQQISEDESLRPSGISGNGGGSETIFP